MTSTSSAVAPVSPVAVQNRCVIQNVPPLFSATMAAVMLWTAFPGNPPPSWDWFAWFALAPLFALVQSDRRAWNLYLSSWVGGLIFWLLALSWIREVDPDAWLGWVCMAVFLSLWWPGFLWLARLAHLGARIPLLIAVPISWVGLEYTRAHVLTGFPWYYLAHTQYRNIALIQIGDLTGAWGLSFLIALVNALIAEALSSPLLLATNRGLRVQRCALRHASIVLLTLVGT